MKLLDIAKRTVDKAVKMGASQAEASVFVADNTLARFSKNRIHQNVSTRNYYVNLEVVVDKNKLGSSSVNSIEEKSLDVIIERALKIATVSTPDPEFKSLASPKKITPLTGIYSKKTAETTPEDIAEGVKTVIDAAMDYSKQVRWSAGAFSRDIMKTAISNSLGVEGEVEYTTTFIEVNTRAGEEDVEGSGFCVKRSRDVEDFNFEEIALSAAKDAVNSINPRQIPLGDYETIFRPEAVSTFTTFIGLLGLSAKANQEGYSFIGDKLGSKVFDGKLSIVDNGRDLSTLNSVPYDGDGIPKKALTLVDKGVAVNLCYDNYHALKEGKESTGHALLKFGRGFWYRGVPLPVNQIVETGDVSIEEMIEGTKKGVLITRLHYVNPIRRDLAIISGMTRDGTWYIENGEIKHSLKMMRFTDSVTRVMGAIDALGNQSTVEKLYFATAPAIKSSNFKFTGHSEF